MRPPPGVMPTTTGGTTAPMQRAKAGPATNAPHRPAATARRSGRSPPGDVGGGGGGNGGGGGSGRSTQAAVGPPLPPAVRAALSALQRSGTLPPGDLSAAAREHLAGAPEVVALCAVGELRDASASAVRDAGGPDRLLIASVLRLNSGLIVSSLSAPSAPQAPIPPPPAEPPRWRPQAAQAAQPPQQQQRPPADPAVPPEVVAWPGNIHVHGRTVNLHLQGLLAPGDVTPYELQELLAVPPSSALRALDVLEAWLRGPGVVGSPGRALLEFCAAEEAREAAMLAHGDGGGGGGGARGGGGGARGGRGGYQQQYGRR